MFDDFPECVAALRQVSWRKLALEDRVLEVISEIPHRLEDTAEAFVVTDVVADDICRAHGVTG
jgi:hypothetical protein